VRMRRVRSSFAIALGVRWVRVDFGVAVVVAGGDTMSQPVVLLRSLVGLGFGLAVAAGGGAGEV
jgi:hypothetical protein